MLSSLLNAVTSPSLWSRALQDNTTDTNITNVTDPCEDVDTEDSLAYTISINILVFFTVWGISAVVDIKEFKQSFTKPPIYAGAAFQFLLMPFIGFITVTIFPLENLQAIALLILCASPGGSFSNWWCNLFNADLALSVSMTSLSTVASIFMLPLNIVVYITLAYERTQEFDEEADEVEVDFADLGLTLGVVISAILLGLCTGATFPKLQTICNIIGNVAGMASIILGVTASTDTCDGKAPWEQPFFPLWVATAFPLLVALIGVLILGTLLRLPKPQRVAIALETAYQNTSISLAYSLSQGLAGRRAAGVPVIYGGYEAGFFGVFMLLSWKLGWTYAPPNDRLWKVMFDNYQPGGDNHKRLFPNYYELKPEAEEFNKSIRSSLRKSMSKVLGAGADEIPEAEAIEDKEDEAEGNFVIDDEETAEQEQDLGDDKVKTEKGDVESL